MMNLGVSAVLLQKATLEPCFLSTLSWSSRLLTQPHILGEPHIHIKSIHPQYFGLTAAAGGSKELFVAVLAVDRSLLLHKASVCQWWAAVGTVKLLLVPRSPHGHQEGSSEGQRGVGVGWGGVERQTRRWKSTCVFTFYYAADSSREWWHSEWRASKQLPMGIAD